MWIGCLTGSNLKLCSDAKLDWVESLYILGITLTSIDFNNIWKVNYLARLEELKREFQKWKIRNLSLLGKITVIKSLALSKLIHLFLSLPDPPIQVIHEINTLLFKFIWNNGPDRIKRSVLTLEYAEGGLRMVNLFQFIQALKVTWMRRLILSEGNWTNINFTSEQREKMCTLGSSYIKILLRQTQNPFWINVLSAWEKLQNNTEVVSTNDILNQCLWYNKKIKRSQQIVNNWYRNKIICIKDIFNRKWKDYQL